MRHGSVDYDDRFHSSVDDINAAFDFRDHSAGNRTVPHQALGLLERQFLDQLSLLIQNALDIREKE